MDTRRTSLWATIPLLLLPLTSLYAAESPSKPNIVFILADDLGYGDLGCYGATKIETPHCDQLAREGLRFTDAHAPSAMCTPTRYSFLTGEYAWRKRNTGILSGITGLIIEPGRLTVPSLLRQAGYTTGVVGKWHLGLGTTPTDYNAAIKPGPLDIGFDYAWLLPATGDRVPCVWVENRHVVNLDPGDPIRLDYRVKRGEPRSYVMGVPRIGAQTGGKAALWKDDEIADVLAERSVAFIERHKGSPFFLYLATHDIHVPRVPHARFRGSSQAGVRGDAVVSFDWTVGRVLEALDRLKLAKNTLVIVTSDNGGNLESNGPDTVNAGTLETNNGHAYNGSLRGGKYEYWEGGTRVPFIVRWPGRIKPGESDALIALVDMMNSLAALTGQSLPAGAGPDSCNVLPSLIGKTKAGRDSLVLVEHGARGLALRQGAWKYVPASPGQWLPRKSKRAKKATGACLLFDLSTDLGETRNVAQVHPTRVKSMGELLKNVCSSVSSRPQRAEDTR